MEVTPDGSKVYVGNGNDSTVSVIDTATNTVSATIPIGGGPRGLAVTPDGSKVYVANGGDSTVSVIDTATDTVIDPPIPVGLGPFGVAVTPDGSKVYVANSGRLRETSTVSVIDTATDTVSATKTVGFGSVPTAFGKFIGPPQPEFAGTPGFSNCHGHSVAALSNQFGGLKAAAAALGFHSVKALQDAIRVFCG